MVLPDFMIKLLEWIGIKDSEAVTLRKLKDKLISDKASNVDKIEAMKEEIKLLERQAVSKKAEYEAAKGNIRRIIAGEIEQLFSNIDRLKTRENIILQNIDKISVALTKIEELVAAKEHGLDSDVFDDMASELEDKFDDLKTADKAKDDIEKIRYEPRRSEKTDVEPRLSELNGEKEPPKELSQSAQQRLKELVGEE